MRRARFQYFSASLALLALGWAWSCCAAICLTGAGMQAERGRHVEPLAVGHACCPMEQTSQGQGEKPAKPCEEMPCSGSLACPMQAPDVIVSGMRSMGDVLKSVLLPLPPVAGMGGLGLQFVGVKRIQRDAWPDESIAWRSTLLTLGTMMTT